MKYDLKTAHNFLEEYLKMNIDIEYIACESIEFESNELDEELFPKNIVLPTKVMTHAYLYGEYYLYYINTIETNEVMLMDLLKDWDLVYYKFGDSYNE
ncbi:hypothetical protein [Miniphocaeibacter halophilus]|uniref:Uncharacterized protein n=1 Tax=Miniphocaeibacter halophilus TaxID=2931922 RepID=A0AC61N397_9FIRM|nr:hypothetical protein [Miniphocaeibacter halophilus]QQK09018.1 hypothetical protein JFY71_05635 [Miniphocaeibacter halophilus]